MLDVGSIYAGILYMPDDSFDKSRNMSQYNVEKNESKYTCDFSYSSIIEISCNLQLSSTFCSWNGAFSTLLRRLCYNEYC